MPVSSTQPPNQLSHSERRWGRSPAVSERHTCLGVSAARTAPLGAGRASQQKSPTCFRRSGMGMRQRPTLPGRLQPSTIGVLRLNFCVRNGNRWNPQAITTAICERCLRALPCTLTTVYEYLLRDLFLPFLLAAASRFQRAAATALHRTSSFIAPSSHSV